MSRRRKNKNQNNSSTSTTSVKQCDYCHKELTTHPLEHWISDHRFQDRDMITDRVREIHRALPEMQRNVKRGNHLQALLECVRAFNSLHGIQKILLISQAAKTFSESKQNQTPVETSSAPTEKHTTELTVAEITATEVTVAETGINTNVH